MPVPIMALATLAAQAIPSIAGWFGGDDAEKTAEKVISVAKQVTGLGDGEKAVSVLSSNPETALAVEKMLHEWRIEQLRADERESQRVTDRAASLEGTAETLSETREGRFMLFVRAIQRPIWGFFTMLADWMLFSGQWNCKLTNDTGAWTAEGAAIFFINILVLGFLFGERTVKNLLPLLGQFMQARNGGSK